MSPAGFKVATGSDLMHDGQSEPMQRLVVGSVGAVVLVLAAVGLAVDLDRGGVHEVELQPVPTASVLNMQLEVTPGGTGPLGGPCLPSPCAGASSSLTMVVSQLPAFPGLAYVVDVGADLGLGPMTQQGDWRFFGDFDRDISGETVRLRIVDPAGGSRTLAVTDARDRQAEPIPIVLVEGRVVAQTEQIGAVEVSALLRIDADVTLLAGLELAVWIDDSPVGIIADGALDERIERLDLGKAKQMDVVLQPSGTGFPSGGAPRMLHGPVVFTTAL